LQTGFVHQRQHGVVAKMAAVVDVADAHGDGGVELPGVRQGQFDAGQGALHFYYRIKTASSVCVGLC
jgi:hypothetical protein